MRRKLNEIVKDVHNLVERISSVSPGPATKMLQLNVIYLIDHSDYPIDSDSMQNVIREIHYLAENLADVTPSPATTKLRVRTQELMNYPVCDKRMLGDESMACSLKEDHTGACYRASSNTQFNGVKRA